MQQPEPPPTVALSVAPNPVREGKPVTVTARLSKALASDVMIPVALTADTAEASDYGPLARITIHAGTTSGVGTVTTAEDTDTDDERFTVSLGSGLPPAVRAGSPSSVVVTIKDDDEPPPPPTVRLSVAPNPVREGAPVTVTARLSGALASDVTIPVALTADTAETGDYGPLARITIHAGTTSGVGTVTTAEDTDTDDEQFTVALGRSLPVTVRAGSPSSVAVTIKDDDEPPPPTVRLSVAPNPVREGAPVTVTAWLSGALANDVTIPMALTADTAETGDYGPLASITIRGGMTSGVGTVTTAQDADTDDEQFVVALGSLPATVRAGSPNMVAVTITDDDEPVAPQTPPQTLTLRAAPAPVEGGGPVTVTATLDAAALSGGTRVTLVLSGTATAGASGDYTMSSRTIEIAEGSTVGTATLRVTDDEEDEDEETVVIAAVGANPALTAQSLTLTIADNDEAGVTVSRAALSVAEGDTATYTVQLASRPTAEVAIAATSGTPAKATVTPVTLTFTPEDWNEAKTITVTGMEAGVSTITHGASSTDGKYGGGLGIGAVAVTVTAVQERVVKPVWLARFGRTVTWQVLEAVEERLTAPREAGAQAMLAGYELAEWTPGTVAASDHEWADGVGESGLGAWDAVGEAEQARKVTERELLESSSFALTGGADAGGGQAGLWGRGAHGRFDGRDGELVLDGEVTAGLVGADWASAPGSGTEAGGWSAGVAVGHARGAGGYRSTSHGRGAVEAALTGLYPYAGYALTDWLSAWAAAGYGAGDVTVKERGRTALQADLTLAMGAAGLRSEVVRAPADGEGLTLAVTGDARYTHTSSEAAHTSDGNLAALEAGTWLARAGVEGERRFGLGEGGGGAWLTPSIEVGARVDGGAAEKGIGADLGGGLAFAVPASGLSVDLKARVLVAHEVRGFREWGASAALAYDPWPETERGLSLALRQSWGGEPAGGMGALLTREAITGLAGNSPGEGSWAGGDTGRLEGEVGYGLAVHGGGFIGTPNIGIGLSHGGVRDWRIGWRLTTEEPGAADIEVRLDAIWSAAASSVEGSENGVQLQSTIRW